MSISEVAEAVDSLICTALGNPKENYYLLDYATRLAVARMGMSCNQTEHWDSAISQTSQDNA